jgi:hypothetical protein
VRNIQDWFKEHQPNNRQQIFISDKDIKEPLEGKELIIKDYTQLKQLYISVKQLEYITIENCEQLGSIDTHGAEIKLIGNCSKLRIIKTHNQAPAVIIQEKKEPIICKKCISIFLFFVIIFTWFYRHIEKKFKNLKEYHNKHCKDEQKTIKN